MADQDFVLVVTYAGNACEPSVAVVREATNGAVITHLRELGSGNVKRDHVLGTAPELDLVDLDVARLATHVAVGEDVDGPWIYLSRRRRS